MTSEQRLHPISLLFRLGERLRELVIPIIVLLFVTRSRSGLDQIATTGVVLALTTLGAAAQYFSFRYRYDASDLVVRWGFLFRKQRHIPYERIQNIDAVQGPMQRLFGVVTVVVQTGSGTEPEATFSVLPLSALGEMRERVFAGRGSVRAEIAAGTSAPASTPAVLSADRVLLRLGPRELMLAGFIENRGMTLVLGALGILSQIDSSQEWLNRELVSWLPGLRWDDLSAVTATAALALWAVAIFIAVLAFVRLLSVVWALVRLYDFTLTRRGDDLRAQYGLLTRVTATIPIQRIQTVSIHEGYMHRWAKRAAVRVTTAGGGAGKAGTVDREWVAPIVARDQLASLLAELYPGLALQDLEWRPPHPKAFARMARRALILFVPPALITPFVVGWWALPVVLTLAGVTILHARLQVPHMGWTFLQDGVAFRAGWLNRSTTAAPFKRVQCVELSESPFDRRSGMATVAVDTAGASIRAFGMSYLPRNVALHLRDVIAEHSAQTAFTW